MYAFLCFYKKYIYLNFFCSRIWWWKLQIYIYLSDIKYSYIFFVPVILIANFENTLNNIHNGYIFNSYLHKKINTNINEYRDVFIIKLVECGDDKKQ